MDSLVAVVENIFALETAITKFETANAGAPLLMQKWVTISPSGTAGMSTITGINKIVSFLGTVASALSSYFSVISYVHVTDTSNGVSTPFTPAPQPGDITIIPSMAQTQGDGRLSLLYVDEEFLNFTVQNNYGQTMLVRISWALYGLDESAVMIVEGNQTLTMLPHSSQIVQVPIADLPNGNYQIVMRSLAPLGAVATAVFTVENSEFPWLVFLGFIALIAVLGIVLVVKVRRK
jgi:hypothetical protein